MEFNAFRINPTLETFSFKKVLSDVHSKSIEVLYILTKAAKI